MNKLASILLVWIFLLSSCTNEYIAYHNKIIQNERSEAINASKSLEFSLDKIKDRDVDIMETPDIGVLDRITGLMDSTKKRLYVEVYILTEKRIIKSMIDAHKRWVDVKAVFEKNVFGAWNINKKAYDSLKASWIDVTYASTENYKYTHSKYMILDDSYLISTGNFSYSSFKTNKEIFVSWNDMEDVSKLVKIFDSDHAWERLVVCDNWLVVSPFCPQNELLTLIDSAKSSIYVYDEVIDDKDIENALSAKKATGVDVKVIVWDTKKVSANTELIKRLSQKGIEILAPKKPFVHAKMIMVDSKFAYIWSINLTKNSISNNREVWIILKYGPKLDLIKNNFLAYFSK